MQWAKQTQKGFTIVELLIVVVVIAILAAITIVSFAGIQNRAHDTAVQSNIKDFGKLVELQNAEKGAYPFPLTNALGVKFSRESYEFRNNIYYCINPTTNQYAIGAISKSGKGYYYSSVSGMREYSNGSASISGQQTCNQVGHSTWNTSYGTMALEQSTGWAPWVN